MSSTTIKPKKILETVFGYQAFRPSQEEIISTLIEGNDCLVVMPTGGGKSLCYQVPALALDGLTIVVSPLISLMKDQVDQLVANGVAAKSYHSGLSREEQGEVMQACRNGEVKLLYVSPERIMTDHFIAWLELQPLALLAIDEAHCISQWGHDFRPEYRLLGEFKTRFPQTPVIALTATADEVTRNDIIQRLALQNPFISISSFDRPNIRYTVIDKHKPTEQLYDFIKRQQGKSGIIYCSSRKKTEQTAEQLQAKGLKVDFYHAGLDAEMRNRVQEDFLRDNIQIIVATVAFGMGINKPNVRFVVHYDIPRNIESYYQETGRAGRDGMPAQAVLFYESRDVAWLRQCLEEKPAELQPLEKHKLNAMAAFAEALTCRRLVLLNYFGENRQSPCGNCDICLSPPKKYDGLLDAQKALSTIYRTGQRYGLTYISEVLRGAIQAKIKERGHDKLSVFGIGKQHSDEYWLSVIRQLIHQGIIVQNPFSYFALQLTPAARPILRAEQGLQLALPRSTSQILKSNDSGSSYTTSGSSAKRGRSPARIDLKYDSALFAKLKYLRKQIADESDIPPYVVFNDATLAEMAAKMPTTPKQLLAINGVGQIKLEKFGALFIEKIRNYLDKSA